MKKEKISAVIGDIASRHIEEALDYGQAYQEPVYWKRIKKAAACAALVIIALSGAFVIAYSANAGFRGMVTRLFSGFSEEEKILIENGHMTGNLDKTDTLIGFLHNFNDNDMGNGEKVKSGDDGFEYKFLEENIDSANIIAACESGQYSLLINMKGTETGDGVMAWKVASYQLVSYEEAEQMTGRYFPEPENAQKTKEAKETKKPDETENPMDSVIRASKRHARIYNTPYYDKAHNIVERKIASLSEEETEEARKIFDKYQNDNDGEMSDINLIIVFDKREYVITEEGWVTESVVHKNGLSGKEIKIFKMTKKDLQKIMSLFDKYKIPH